MTMLALSLHLAQHLPAQARVRRAPALNREMFVERALQP